MAMGYLVPGCNEEHRERRGWKHVCFGQRKGMVLSALCQACNAGSLCRPAPWGQHEAETWHKYLSLPAPGNTNLLSCLAGITVSSAACSQTCFWFPGLFA